MTFLLKEHSHIRNGLARRVPNSALDRDGIPRLRGSVLCKRRPAGQAQQHGSQYEENHTSLILDSFRCREESE
jgi:hypothetical protein